MRGGRERRLRCNVRLRLFCFFACIGGNVLNCFVEVENERRKRGREREKRTGLLTTKGLRERESQKEKEGKRPIYRERLAERDRERAR